MKSTIKASLAIAALAAASLSPATAAYAGGMYGGGSMKDAPMVANHASAGRCYLRGDVGYSYGDGVSATFDSPNYATMDATSESIDGAWMGEIGIGCGSGSRGFRADLTLGYRSERGIDGGKPDAPGFHFPADFSTKVNTLTAMANLYYDFGRYRNWVPYVGVGIGIARHDVGDVSFTNVAGNPPGTTFNNLNGSTQTNFAWSLMAGAAYQISHRAVLDFGYRYIDMGDVSVRGNICDVACVGGSRDRLSIDDMHAHEFKIGLRYHFGGHRQPVAYK